MEARQAAEARQQVTALYQAHALGLVKLAVLMVGDQLTAEDVVQEGPADTARQSPCCAPGLECRLSARRTRIAADGNPSSAARPLAGLCRPPH
jgi:hypothetical protein